MPVIIPAVDGTLLVHTPGKGVQRSPLKASQLVARAPFIAGGKQAYISSSSHYIHLLLLPFLLYQMAPCTQALVHQKPSWWT